MRTLSAVIARAVAPVLALGLSTGCGAVVEPGHRALLFDPRSKGLHHEVLGPGCRPSPPS